MILQEEVVSGYGHKYIKRIYGICNYSYAYIYVKALCLYQQSPTRQAKTLLQ